MKNRASFALLAVLVLAKCAPATIAQEKHHPEITIGHRGTKALRDDLKFLFSLTSPREQKQLEKYNEFTELLLYGIDEKKPLRIDVLLGTPTTTTYTYVVWGYWSAMGELLENIDANYPFAKRSSQLYEILEPPGWLRLVKKQRYGIFLLTTKKQSERMKQYIQKLSGLETPLKQLLIKGVNIGLSLTNKAITEDDQKKRRGSFAELRNNRLAIIKKRPTETATEFAIRRKFIEDEIDEVERLLVESADTKVLVSMDKAAKTAKIALSVKAIPKTSLAKSIGLFNKTPDRFASVPKRKDGVLSGRINHPIDEMRQQNYLEFTDLLKQDMYARADKDKQNTGDRKTATTALIDGIVSVVSDGIRSGNVNAFIESSAKGLNFSSVVGVTAVDADRLNEILPLISQANPGNEFQADVAKVKEVRIHRVKLLKGYFDMFDQVFGENQTVYIGVEKDIVWFGVGEDSLQPLTNSIETLGAPAENGRVLTVDARLQPWYSRTIDLVKRLPTPTELKDRKAQTDRLRNLTIAQEAYAKKDRLLVSFEVEDDTVKGDITFDEGTLTFVGRLLALIGKNNL